MTIYIMQEQMKDGEGYLIYRRLKSILKIKGIKIELTFQTCKELV